MKHLPFVSLLLACGLAPMPATAADEPAPASVAGSVPADPQEARARARELRERADVERKAAEARFSSDEAACYSKFLVNSCLEDARKARNAALVAARKPEAEARDIERSLRQREVDANAAKLRERAARQQKDGGR